MFSISINVQNYIRDTEVFTLSSEFNSFLILHEKGNFKETDEVDKKTISKADFDKIAKAFSEINFTEVFNEQPDLMGLDGWILTCSIQNDTAKISAQIWCPEKDQSKPETTKLLEACEKVFSLFESQNLLDKLSE